ncbi:hypothetical protein [Roseospira visakhapatnamensis]|uniref:Uncharacterized protein n=1 Tax=Roseospira visakhapatnamensis TaxID=390880 RepID=A0A7W6RF91_9PROT|nr:hypothetical protein [Roseospira visakhapatnamensis]MBB4267352.1 hypothetical protein [Roseospira visakhapatnamensis]
MSLSCLALRLATVAALRGRTLAGDAVADSARPALEGVAPDARPAVAAVYTDREETAPRAADLLAGAARGVLSVETAVMARAAPDGPWTVPVTDADAEATLDRLDRQIRHALMDAQNPWARLWRRLVADVSAVTRHRDADADAEARDRPARHHLRIDLVLLAEPPAGHTATGVWADLLVLLAADTSGLAAWEPVVRAEIEGDAPTPRPTPWPAHWEHDAAEALGHDLGDPRTTIGPLKTVVTHPRGHADP